MNGPSTAGFRQTVTLSHRTAKADIHELLCVGRERCSPRHHQPHPTTQQSTDLLEESAESTAKSTYLYTLFLLHLANTQVFQNGVYLLKSGVS